MGTDIHAYVEIQQEDGTWKYLSEPVFPNPYYRPDDKDDPFGWNVPKISQPFRNRDYDLFGILAGVRREEHDAIAPDRGLPDDLSPELMPLRVDWDSLSDADREKAENWPWLGDHSFTWLTVEELFGYDWEGTAEHEGYLTFHTWKKWVDDGRQGEGPQGWCMNVHGGGIVKIKDADFTEEEIIKKHEELDPPDIDEEKAGVSVRARLYIWTRWGNTYRQSVGSWLFKNIFPVLNKLADEAGGQDKVRIVMGFDS